MLRSGYMWVFAVLLVGCAQSAFELPARLEFGEAAIHEERTAKFVVRNVSKVDDLVELSATASFRTEPTKFELKAGAETEVVVFFRPTELGPRDGVLTVRSIHSSARGVTLVGRGVGPALETAPSVVLPTIALVFGQSAGESRGVLLVRNVGTLSSLLNLELPESSGPELCVGDFIGNECAQWIPNSIAAGEFVEVPLTLRVVDDVERSWLVTLRSNDVRSPTRTVQVFANVESVAPCQFEAVPELTLSQSAGFVFITHTGSQRCRVESMELEATPRDSLEFLSSVSLPRLLEPGESISQALRIKRLASFVAGKLTVRAAGTPALEIPLRPADGANPCVVVTPSALRFGALRQTCASPLSFVAVYNVCPSPIQLAQIHIAGNDFFVFSAELGRDIVRGGPPALIGVKFLPSEVGVRTGALVLSTMPYTQRVIALQGIGDGPAFNTDTFRQDERPRADLAVIVDTSPSFAAQRSAVRTQVEALLTSSRSTCADVNFGFAPAEGTGPVAFSANDAGNTWTSNQEFDFVNRALSAFDALPASTETEHCIGVAERLASSARPNVLFSGLCITDALEQTPDAGGALAGLRAQVAQLSWNVVTGLPASSCAVEANDDDQVHRSLAASGFGLIADVCRPDWVRDFVPNGTHHCGVRTNFFLTSRALPPIEVRIDGQIIATGWTYEPANNAIQFDPASAPQPGKTLEISYATSCTP